LLTTNKEVNAKDMDDTKKVERQCKRVIHYLGIAAQEKKP